MPAHHLDPIVRAAYDGEAAAGPSLYDFARPRAFSDRQLRTAEAAHGAFADGVAAALGDALGTTVAAHCSAVTEVLAVDMVNSRAQPTAFVPLALGPGGPRLALDLAPSLALFLVERQLGGTDPLGTEGRALSALESAVVLRDWLPRLGVAFAEAWGTVPPVSERLHASAERAALAPPEATMVVADLTVTVGGVAAGLSVCYPAAALRALLDAYRPGAAPPTEPSADRAEGLRIDVQAELGRVRIPIGDLLRLAEGDVIPLNRAADAPLAVWVGNQLRCQARAGTRGPNLALQLLSPPSPPSTP